MADMEGVPAARFLMDSWIMAGLLAVTAVTTTMGAVGWWWWRTGPGVLPGLQTSPIKRSTIVGGYLLSTLTVGVVMGLVALLLTELYIVANGGSILPIAGLVRSLALFSSPPL